MKNYKKYLLKKSKPKGQKFYRGDIVKIDNPMSWYSKAYYKKDKDRLYEIEHSYHQKFGSEEEEDFKLYSLNHLWEKNSSAWYHEDELKLFKK